MVQTHPDECGVVRTVTIQLRPRHAKEKAVPYKGKQMTEFPVAVQRLAVIVPVEEQEDKQLGYEQEESTDDSDDATEIGTDDFGAGLPVAEVPCLRRSCHVQGEPPEPFLAAVGHNLVPKPWNEESTTPAAAISLHSGAIPLLVPVWLPEVFEEENKKIQCITSKKD